MSQCFKSGICTSRATLPAHLPHRWELSQQAGTWSQSGQFIAGIPQRTVFQRKAAATDAEIQLIASLRRQFDFFFESLIPNSTDFLPVGLRLHAPLGDIPKGSFDFLERESKTLSHLDKGQNAKLPPGKTALIPPIADAMNQLFGFVKVDCRDGNPTPTGDLTDRQQLLTIFSGFHKSKESPQPYLRSSSSPSHQG